MSVSSPREGCQAVDQQAGVWEREPRPEIRASLWALGPASAGDVGKCSPGPLDPTAWLVLLPLRGLADLAPFSPALPRWAGWGSAQGAKPT